ncbi:MAG: YqgE/AlgH family protein [Rhodospirillales bacterium]|nr:YqgE/AlgH family protein [Alphaproteobacteria bacterium]MBL6948050.1 YqgE/AlgH family protein [Rhodospirillales bacterium]
MIFLGLAAATVRAGEPSSQNPVDSLYLKGQLLVASPEIQDPRFMESVIYMVNHDQSGAFGLIINKSYGSGPLKEFLKGFDVDVSGVEGTINLYFGGPVMPGAGFVLHTADYEGPGTNAVNKDFAVTTEKIIMQAIAEGRGPRNSLFAYGYSGWGPGQLENEIRRGDWLSAPADMDLVFDTDQKTKWKRASGKARLKL